MTAGCLCLQETPQTPSGSPSSTKASGVLKFSGVTMEFSLDPGNAVTTQALLDPLTHIPCPQEGGTPIHPLGDLGGPAAGMPPSHPS